MQYSNHILHNGLRLVHLPSNSPVAYCGFAINTGSRDEHAGEFGIAHFVEHMLFKGTVKRKSSHIINRMENVGGELNAYTTKEETILYSIFPVEYFKRAFELLSDLVLNSKFPENETKKEIEIVLDEINSYKDNPSELIYDEFENLIFAHHKLGHNILGTAADLESFSSQTGQSFYNNNYRQDNMVFFSMGNIEFKRIIYWAESFFANSSEKSVRMVRTKPESYTPAKIKESIDTFQAHAIIGNRAFDLYDERRMSLSLLNNILGGPGMNSRLNMILREKKGYVYNVESSLSYYTDTGIFSIYFGTDQKNIDKCMTLVLKELKSLRDNPLTSLQLSSAKKQLKGQINVGTDNKENIALNMGKSYLRYDKIDDIHEIYQKIDAVTITNIWDTANIIFDENNLSTLIYT